MSRAKITQICKSLGIKKILVVDDELRGRCPWGHHEDIHPSWGINLDSGLSHCLGGETRIITGSGRIPIRKAAKYHSVAVLTHDKPGKGGPARWVEVKVLSFGKMRLWKLVLSRNGREKKIFTTSHHRWFIRRRKNHERITEDLKPGMGLAYAFPQSRIKRSKPSPIGVAHGIVFGDGTVNNNTASVNLWGESQELIRFFPCIETTEVETPNGVKGIRVYYLPTFFKRFPSFTEATSYLYGFVAGYFAADGCVNQGGTPSIASSKRYNLEQLQTLCDILGIDTYDIRHQDREGIDGKLSRIYSLTFVRSSLIPEFFIRSKHRRRYENSNIKYQRRGWMVKSVEQTSIYDEVYCAIVPQTHCFALDGNILTGNCFACNEDANLITLVMHLKEMSLWEAKQYLNEVLPDYTDVSDVARQIQALQVDQRNLYLDNIIMDAYLNIEDVCESCRNIPFYIYRRYGVKYDPITGKIAIPVYDEFGRLRVVIGRKVDSDRQGPKYKPLVPESGARFKDVLYGSYQQRGQLHFHEITVTEGYWGVYRLTRHGINNVVALMGTAMSDGQFRRLMSYDQVILLLDPDEAGREATKRIAKMLSRCVRCLIPRKQYEKEPDLWNKKETFEALSSLKLAL